MGVTLLEYLNDNFEDIVELDRLYRMDSFKTFSDNQKQARLYKRLISHRESYIDSPEDLIIQEEDNKAMLTACMNIRRKIGDKKFEMLWMRYGHKRKISSIAKQMGYSKQYISKAVRKSLRESMRVLVDMIQRNELDSDVLRNTIRLYVASTPKYKVRYPFDSAKNTWSETKVRNNKMHYKTKCLVPEYLNESFGDTKTVCLYCQNHLGESLCTRKSCNKGV